MKSYINHVLFAFDAAFSGILQPKKSFPTNFNLTKHNKNRKIGIDTALMTTQKQKELRYNQGQKLDLKNRMKVERFSE